MLADIENALLARLEEKGLSVDSFEVKKGTAGIPRPAVHASTDAGDLRKVSQNTFKLTVIVSVYVLFRNVRKEKDRRHGVYPILEGILGILTLQNLGLAIDPLVPRRFRNVTDAELEESGAIAFLVQFETAFNVTRTDDEAAADLLAVGLNYYLKPGDDVSDASDVVTLGT